MSNNPENSPAPVSGHLNSEIPLPSARDLWPAWTAVGLLFAAVSFIVYFRYHSIVGPSPRCVELRRWPSAHR